MLSICVPIYNFNVRELIIELERQQQQLLTPVEILLIDDCSSDEFKLINQQVCLRQDVYIQLEENIGRSAIRNSFLSIAKFDYLLFLDCDSVIYDDNFLQNYIDAITESTKVICGGRVYPKQLPSKEQALRWHYGISREVKTSIERQKNPNQSFLSNNFVVQKSVLVNVPFNEVLTKYGHEDTLFGFDLQKQGIEITHIENPVLNGDIETNEEFLSKTEKGLENLKAILGLVENSKELIQEIRLLKVYFKFEHLMPFYLLMFSVFKSTIKSELINNSSNIRLFDLYKLGIFAETMKK